jgi:hypothetical protein
MQVHVLLIWLLGIHLTKLQYELKQIYIYAIASRKEGYGENFKPKI